METFSSQEETAAVFGQGGREAAAGLRADPSPHSHAGGSERILRDNPHHHPSDRGGPGGPNPAPGERPKLHGARTHPPPTTTKSSGRHAGSFSCGRRAQAQGSDGCDARSSPRAYLPPRGRRRPWAGVLRRREEEEEEDARREEAAGASPPLTPSAALRGGEGGAAPGLPPSPHHAARLPAFPSPTARFSRRGRRLGSRAEGRDGPISGRRRSTARSAPHTAPAGAELPPRRGCAPQTPGAARGAPHPPERSPGAQTPGAPHPPSGLQGRIPRALRIPRGLHIPPVSPRAQTPSTPHPPRAALCDPQPPSGPQGRIPRASFNPPSAPQPPSAPLCSLYPSSAPQGRRPRVPRIPQEPRIPPALPEDADPKRPASPECPASPNSPASTECPASSKCPASPESPASPKRCSLYPASPE
ncbi:basic salivary proline-rich protein 2-like [Cuculus canorus]|uniref:basic salivary proline-rich protein 2-like n=1 Tax=Cuculus canorus TaxID=55661 RepID=UPI0023AA5AE7|nr:basic salivary proline-rich protein 2-like [Cuculus canorus]